MSSFIDPDRRNALFWRLQFLGWGGVLAVSMSMVAFKPVIILVLLRTLFGLAVTSFVFRPFFRYARQKAPLVSLPRVVALAVLCGVAGTMDVLFLHWTERLHEVSPSLAPTFAFIVLVRTALYVLWSILYFGIHLWLDTQLYQLQAARSEAAQRAGELQMLRSQVNPHFLFNALNSILASTDDPPAARQITLALSDYLRFSLQQKNDTGYLGDEIAALNSYLCVEKMRFENDLEYEIHVTPAAMQTVVPVALVQPLLENAIKYGQSSTIRPVRITIHASVEKEALHLAVSNSGPWVERVDESHGSTGIGLANLRRRLQLLYGDAASCTHLCVPDRVTAQIRLSLSLPSPVYVHPD